MKQIKQKSTRQTFKVVNIYKNKEDQLNEFISIKNSFLSILKNSTIIFDNFPIQIYENVKKNIIFYKKVKKLDKNSDEIRVIELLNKLILNKSLYCSPFVFKMETENDKLITFGEYISFNFYQIITEYPINTYNSVSDIVDIIKAVLIYILELRKYDIYHNDLHIKNIMVNEIKDSSFQTTIIDWEFSTIGINEYNIKKFYKNYFPIYYLMYIDNIKFLTKTIDYFDIYKFMKSLEYLLSLNLYSYIIPIYEIIKKYSSILKKILLFEIKIPLKTIITDIIELLTQELYFIKITKL